MNQPRPWSPPPRPVDPPVVVLSNRCAQVLSGLCCGVSTTGMARGLYITENTVKQHIRRLYTALGVHSAAQAVAVALGGQVRVMVREEVS